MTNYTVGISLQKTREAYNGSSEKRPRGKKESVQERGLIVAPEPNAEKRDAADGVGLGSFDRYERLQEGRLHESFRCTSRGKIVAV